MMRAASTNLAGHGRRTFKSGLDSRVTAVLGGQWGDEGKGKLADVLAKNYDIVGRFNGGANAGHTVVANDKKYAFHLLPCGLIYEHTMNILGNGVVVDLDAMFEELEPLDADGLEWRGRLKISDRAPLLFPFHKQIDQFMEDARGDKSVGSLPSLLSTAAAEQCACRHYQKGYRPLLCHQGLQDRSACRSAARLGHFRN